MTVRYDDRRVPHIFAQNDHDLYYAQGYLTARDRLWQMDFIAHVAAWAAGRNRGAGPAGNRPVFPAHGPGVRGREIVKSGNGRPSDHAAGADLLRRRGECLHRQLHARPPCPSSTSCSTTRPEPWEPLKSSLILKYMAFDLSGRSDDLRMSNALAQYGPAVIRDLFPDYPHPRRPR